MTTPTPFTPATPAAAVDAVFGDAGLGFGDAVFGVGVPVFGVSTVELMVRMVTALCVVTVLIVVTARVGRGWQARRPSVGPSIRVEYQQQLSKHTQLTLLTAGERRLLIASNPTNTTLLAEGPDLTTTPTSGAPNEPNSTAKPAKTDGDATPSEIDIRPTPRNPIKHLQNKTVRRA